MVAFAWDGDYEFTVDSSKKYSLSIQGTARPKPTTTGYSVSMAADQTVAAGETVSIPVTVASSEKKITGFNAYDMTFTYDPAALTLNTTSNAEANLTVEDNNGTVRVRRYGETAPLGEALTLDFTAKKGATSTVTLTGAKFDLDANSINFDAPAATISDADTVVNANNFTVTLPDDFTSDAETRLVPAGGSFTFKPVDSHYDYVFTVKVGDTVTEGQTFGEGGTYTVSGVNGNVEVTVDILGKNAVRVSALSPSGDPVTLNAGKIATVTFMATENITAENARIEVKTEALPDYDTLEDNSVNLAGNIIDVTVVTTEEKGYTVSMGADTSAPYGQTVEVPVTIGYSDDSVTGYNAYDMSFSYDSSALKLDMTETNEEGNRVMLGDNSVRIVRYGKEAALGEALTLKFEVLAGKGSSNVTVTSAKVDTNGNAIEADAPDATILRPAATVTVSGYTVTLPDDFTRTDAPGSTIIEAGGNLTFVPKDPNYDYDVKVIVGDQEGTPTVGEDGTYTVPNVNGNVTVTSTKTAKSFNVTLGDDITGNTTATYNQEYTFKLTPASGYTYNVTVTIGGKAYTGFTATTNDDGTTTYTIPGADVTGDIVINSNKVAKPVQTYNVTFTGTGAGDATGASSVKENATYTFTVNEQDGFEYTITATMGGKAVTVTGSNGSYSIANVTGDLVITIAKKSTTTTMDVAVSKFVEMNNKTVFLVTVTGTPEDGKAFAYNENVMYKTTAYGENVYSWLVIVDSTADLTVAEAETKITQAAATAEEVAAGYDVNETGVVDINDAQLTYDIYSGKYTDFEKVSVRKFLRADTNADKVVNAADAVAVVANSK